MSAIEITWTGLSIWAFIRTAQIFLRRLAERYYTVDPTELDLASLNDEVYGWGLHLAKVACLIIIGLNAMFFAAEDTTPRTTPEYVSVSAFILFAILLVIGGEIAQYYFRKRRRLMQDSDLVSYHDQEHDKNRQHEENSYIEEDERKRHDG